VKLGLKEEMFGRSSDMIGLSATLNGEVDPALRLLAETQADLIRGRRGNAGIVDSVGGLLLEAEIEAPLHSAFAGNVMAKIEAYEADVVLARTAAKAAGASLQELLDLPQPLRDLALDSAGSGGWTFAGPGVKSMPIKAGGKLTAKLLRIEPGHGAPNHNHTGTEYTLVVTGAFEDGTGYFGPGDVSIKRAGQIHHPIAVDAGVCIALAVEEGEVAFTGALGVLQRMFTRH
jgi:putative transcriptional regulator